jgi:hypothetical protein
LSIKFLGGRAISYPKIDVIEKTSTHVINVHRPRNLSIGANRTTRVRFGKARLCRVVKFVQCSLGSKESRTTRLDSPIFAPDH